MRQPIVSRYRADADGNPAGGDTASTGLSISWQNGPLAINGQRLEPNGCFVETVILVALDRLEYYQKTKFGCRENALAIIKLQEALHWLGHRTAEREARAVEGTHSV
jgi:hypothetical protein